MTSSSSYYSNFRISRRSTRGIYLLVTLLLLVLLFERGSSYIDPLDCFDNEYNDGIGETPGTPVCSTQDRQALLDFKASVSSDPNKALSDWSASHHNCCAWNGVTCDGATGRVVRLKLPNQNIKGKLAPGLSALSSLRVLILDNNKFSGSIPSSFGNFPKLQRLCLSGNPSISGPIPESFGQLSSLELLDLQANSLSGPIPASFGKMSNLRKLHLLSNKITGPIPASFGLLSKLYSANLGSNRISGRIPDAFGYGLTTLINLFLDNNRITGLPSDLRNLTRLQWIDLSNNPLQHGDAVKGIATMPLISQIELNSCNISGPFPTWVMRLPQPTDIALISDDVTPSLDLGNNAITGRIPPGVSKLTNLEYLGLQNNKLRGSIPASFRKLQSLWGFNVSYNQLSGKIPQVTPFTTFHKSSYTPGNRGLCGSPLTPCK